MAICHSCAFSHALTAELQLVTSSEAEEPKSWKKMAKAHGKRKVDSNQASSSYCCCCCWWWWWFQPNFKNKLVKMDHFFAGSGNKTCLKPPPSKGAK